MKKKEKPQVCGALKQLNLEGQILKKVLLQGVDAGIVCLPVHDAVAVQRRHVDWAVEAMTNAWAEIAYGLRPKVKVE